MLVEQFVGLFKTEVEKARDYGVAFAIDQIDELHINGDHDLNASEDRLLKGIKNIIRKKYEFLYGKDPAPGYPTRLAELKQEGES